MFARHWPLCERVLINLTNGDAIAGLLIEKRGPLLVLAHARLMSVESGKTTQMDGQVFIERDRIAFLQALTPKE